MGKSIPIRKCRPGEDGFILLTVIFLLALLSIALAVAAPRIANSIQRERDIETMERGKQYIRAIQLYYRKFHAYPPTIAALVKTDNIRFLRKQYIDPITGKVDWEPIYFGQNKVPIAMGFFGQPLGGIGGVTAVAGVGPSGGNAAQSSGPGSTVNSGAGSSPGGSLFGSPSSGSSAGESGSSGSSSSGSDTGVGGGQTFGGLGIIGVRPASPKKSILVYKGKDHYNQWEFTYSPLMDMKVIPGATGTGVQPTGSPNGQSTTPGFGSAPGFGGSSSGGSSFGSGFGNSGFGGSSPSTPPTTQQQP